MADVIYSKLLFVNQYFVLTVLTFPSSFSSKLWYSDSVTEDLGKATAVTYVDLVSKHFS